jgi:Rrf2 family cysteine metabolism transcriptional repressor
MIRISTRGRYALRAMVDLALHTDEGPVLRRDIAARQEVSADYVAQLFRHLHEAGLVEGVKGPGGGYLLAREPATISAGDVVRAVEGPVAVVHCILPSDEPSCNRVDRCVTHLLWKRLSAVMTEFLDSVTLRDLCDEAQKLQQEEE